MLYLSAPNEITFQTSYCNVTMESTTAEATPYPYRFECKSIGTRNLMINMQDNFPAWVPAYIDRKVVIYLKYVIADYMSTISNQWSISAYTHASSTSSWNRVSQAVGTHHIDIYQSPYIYKINFPTQAFSKRTCRTN